MKKINLFLAMLLVAMAQILFISCDGNNPEPEEPTTAELILGTWNADQMLFTAGIGEDSSTEEMDMSGVTWDFTADGKLLETFEGETIEYDYQVVGDTLRSTYIEGLFQSLQALGITAPDYFLIQNLDTANLSVKTYADFELPQVGTMKFEFLMNFVR